MTGVSSSSALVCVLPDSPTSQSMVSESNPSRLWALRRCVQRPFTAVPLNASSAREVRSSVTVRRPVITSSGEAQNAPRIETVVSDRGSSIAQCADLSFQNG